MENAIVPLQPQPKLKLILNRGQQELQSATIAVQWFLSDEAIAEKPTHILIVEQSDADLKDAYNEEHNGRRYICELTDGIKFLTLRSPGIHRIAALVFHKKSDNDKFLLDRRDGHYSNCIISHKSDHCFFTVTEITLEVPAELFAKRPETKWGRKKWAYVNSFFAEGPVDECAFGKRQYFAFTLGIPIRLFEIMMKVLYRTSKAIYLLLYAAVLLFFGYRPDPMREELTKVIAGWWSWDSSIKRYNKKRLWTIDKNGKEIFLPIAPSEVAFMVLLSNAIISSGPMLQELASRGHTNWGKLALTIVCIAAVNLALGLLERWFNISTHLQRQVEKLVNWRRKVNAEKPAKVIKPKPIPVDMKVIRENQRLLWLRNQLSLQSVATENGQLIIATPPSKSGRLVQKFTVNFYELKARLCRPFSS